MTFYQMMVNKKENIETNSESKSNEYAPTSITTASKTTKDRVNEILKNDENLVKQVKLDKDDLENKAKAFEKYRRWYRKNEAMEENKSILKAKMQEGKKVGVEAKALKDNIQFLTSKIEEIRKERAMRGMVDSEGNIAYDEEDEKELMEMQTQLHGLKKEYQEKYHKLKHYKAEIDRLRNQIERTFKQCQTDFEEWYKMYNKYQAKDIMEMTSDKQVQDDLKAFYQARDEIYRKG